MADMPNDFWSGYIIGLTVISFFALAWLIWNVYFTTEPDDVAQSQIWDENLREGTHPAPLWWFWLILATMAFSVVYLMLYPGLGSFAGALRYSQGGELAAATAQFNAEFAPERNRIAALSGDQLAADAAAQRTGQHLFQVHCSACHGREAQGQARLFPSLTDDEWQWGSAAAQISQTIAGGRTGVMPPWIAALQAEGAEQVTRYVIALSEGRQDDPEVAAGKTRYEQLCIACHGLDGSGNVLLGAPPLNDSAWTYGGDYDAVYSSIANGRTGVMPAFADKFDATQINALTAWLLSTQ